MTAKNKAPTKQLPFSKNPAAILLVTLNGVLSLATVGVVMFRLRSSDFKVPGQYIASGGEVELTQWYSLYSLAVFAVLSFAISLFLAHKLYKKSEFFAWGIMICQIILGVTALFVSNALLGLVSRL